MNRITHTLRHIRRGAGHLPGMGDHPGTLLALAFVFTAGLAVGDRGARAMLTACGVMGVFVGIPWAYGAYARSIEHEQHANALHHSHDNADA